MAAAANPLRLVRPEVLEETPRGNVLRLADFLGPISPELVLVDEELAPRARALLPELPWNWQQGPREPTKPPVFRMVQPAGLPAPGLPARRIGAIGATLAASAAAFALGVSLAASDRSESSAVPSSVPAIVVEPKPAPKQPAPRPAGSQSKPVRQSKSRAPTAPPRLTPPRFVWPAVAGAAAYRVALYRNNRQVFEREVKTTGLQLPSTWTYRSRLQTLEKGAYRWVVWPLMGAARRQGAAIVSARYGG